MNIWPEIVRGMRLDNGYIYVFIYICICLYMYVYTEIDMRPQV
jgi:hypothetical protein